MSRYYSIDSIIADGQKVPTVFNYTIPGLGYLDNSSSSDLDAGTRLDLPLWLASQLAQIGAEGETEGSTYIDLLSPNEFSAKVVNALKSDAPSVDLRHQNVVYYQLAERWLSIVNDPQLIDVLSDSLVSRLAVIYDQSHNRSLAPDSTDFVNSLDEFELELYKTSHASAREAESWANDRKASLGK